MKYVGNLICDPETIRKYDLYHNLLTIQNVCVVWTLA